MRFNVGRRWASQIQTFQKIYIFLNKWQKTGFKRTFPISTQCLRFGTELIRYDTTLQIRIIILKFQSFLIAYLTCY